MKRATLLVLALAAMPSARAAAQEIDLTGPYYSTTSVLVDGLQNHRWGQTFWTTATDHVLQSFTYDFTPLEAGGHQFKASILQLTSGAFNGGWQPNASISYTTLWTSSLRTEQASGWRETFNTGGLVLDPNEMYWALVEVSGSGWIGLDYHDDGDGNYNAYTIGEMVLWYTAANTPNDSYIFDYGQRYDASFTADFGDAPGTVTPEPVTMTLLGTGLAGVAAARRRRKQIVA